MLTVVTPAPSRRLTTVANVRQDLGIDGPAATDAQIERLIDQATSAIETYCRRVFAQQTYRESYQRYHCNTFSVLFDAVPVTEIVSVSYRGSTLLTTDYELDSNNLYRLGGSGRTYWGAYGLVIDYKAGFIVGGATVAGANIGLPAAVEMACINEIAAIRSRRSRDPMIRSETEDGVGSTSYQIESGTGPLSHPDSAGLLAEYWMPNL